MRAGAPMRREAFVRGVGALSPLGRDWPSTAAALARGESAISRVAHFDVEGFPCQVAAPVRGIAEDVEDRRREFALHAAREAWAQAGVKLPHSSAQQYKIGKKVKKADLRPGDLVFFYSGPSHVGIYVGDGQIIHAPRPGKKVGYIKVSSMPWKGARRPG